jgi:archaellum biogenesis ATPase FlaH
LYPPKHGRAKVFFMRILRVFFLVQVAHCFWVSNSVSKVRKLILSMNLALSLDISRWYPITSLQSSEHIYTPLARSSPMLCPFQTGLGHKSKSVADPHPPQSLAIEPGMIPVELRNHKQWLLWAYVRRKNRWTKVPFSALDGERTSVTDMDRLVFFDVALKALATFKRHAHGVGFVFTEDDPYCGIDLDDCRDPETGRLLDWADELVKLFHSYTEVSPSGTGVKIIVRGQVPGGGNRSGLVEMYDHARYFALTGHVVIDAPRVIPDRQAQLDQLHQRMFDSSKKLAQLAHPSREPLRGGQVEQVQPSSPVLDPRLEAALRDPSRSKLTRLWSGDIRGYTTPSEADLALCSMLGVLLAYDPVAMDRMFRRSGLLRPKWDERRGDSTYGQITVLKVVNGPRDEVVFDDGVLAIDRGDSIVAEPIQWLWPGWIAFGKLTVLEGDPGLGKSTLTMDISARMSKGHPMPLCEGNPPPCGVLIASAEDSAAHTIIPRLEAAQADLKNIHIMRGMVMSEGAVERPIFLPDDLPAIETEVKQTNSRLIIIDPLVAFLGRDRRGRAIDAHKDQSIRLLMAELSRMAERTGAAVLMVRHLNKAQHLSAINRGGGSIGITGAARSVLVMGRDPDNPQARVLAMTKCNLGARPTSLRFAVATVHGRVGDMGVLAWQGHCEHDCDAILKTTVGGEASRTPERDASLDFLNKELEKGPATWEELVTRAGVLGLTEATLRRARAKGLFETYKNGKLGWFWRLREYAELPPIGD